MLILVRILAALGTALIGSALAFFAANRLLPDTRITTRAVAAVCLGYWLLAWTFEVLALAGIFRLEVILVLAAASLVWLLRRPGPLVSLGHGVDELRDELTAAWLELWRSRWVAVGIAAIALHVGIRMLRTLATPAFGWDDFTYHLFRAGRWVQNGGVQLEPAPDAWTYYEFFPWGGDLLWAWGLLWGSGDLLVPVAAMALWSSVWLAAYAGVRELDQGRPAALMIATAIAVLPSQVSQMSTAYVDNGVLAMVLTASLFLLVFLRPEADERQGERDDVRTGAAFLVGAACGIGLLVKTSFLPLLAPAVLTIGWHAVSRRRPACLLAMAVGLAVAAPNLIFNWVMRGSPFYPFEIIDGLPFNEQHSWILSKYGEGATLPELARAARALVVNLFPLDPFLNVGFSGLALVLLGGLGSIRLASSSRGRWYLLWVLVGACLTVVTFFSPRNSSMVVWWTLMMGRFLVPSLAGLMVVGGLLSPRWLARILVPLLVVEYFVYARRGWPPEQVAATLKVAGLIGLLILVAVLLRRWRRKNRFLWPALAVTSALVLLAMIGVREQYRYDAYRLFANRVLMDFHGAPPATAWPIWQRLNESGPHRVAATAGFDGLTGHNWFRGPLLGAWLQNEVIYLPVSSDGRLVSYRDREALLEQADREAWLRRVRAEKIDRIVALGPANIEHRWILDLPEIFPVEISMGRNHFLLVHVDREALQSYLASQK